MFTNLTELTCASMDMDKDKDMAWSLPSIRRLALEKKTTVAVLSRLPADQMLGLHVCFELDHVVDHADNE